MIVVLFYNKCHTILRTLGGETMIYKTKLTPLQKRIENEKGMAFEDIMRSMYVDKQMTMKQIADELDVNLRTVQRWLKECNIQARKMMWG